MRKKTRLSSTNNWGHYNRNNPLKDILNVKSILEQSTGLHEEYNFKVLEEALNARQQARHQ